MHNTRTTSSAPPCNAMHPTTRSQGVLARRNKRRNQANRYLNLTARTYIQSINLSVYCSASLAIPNNLHPHHITPDPSQRPSSNHPGPFLTQTTYSKIQAPAQDSHQTQRVSSPSSTLLSSLKTKLNNHNHNHGQKKKKSQQILWPSLR